MSHKWRGNGRNKLFWTVGILFIHVFLIASTVADDSPKTTPSTFTDPSSISTVENSDGTNGSVPTPEVRSTTETDPVTEESSNSSSTSDNQFPSTSSNPVTTQNNSEIPVSTSTSTITSGPTLAPNVTTTTTSKGNTQPPTTENAGEVSKSTENSDGGSSTVLNTEAPSRVDKAGPPTWAIVLIALMLSFSGIFTGLFFLRKYCVKKRKEERRHLLSSRSQEGFFFGDQYSGSENL